MQPELLNRLRYPFAAKMNPHASSITDKAQDWIKEYTCLPGNMIHRYKQSRFDLLGPLFYPQASLERLIPLSRLLMWFFPYDDFLGPQPLAELHETSRKAVAILAGEPVVIDNDIMQQLKVFSSEIAIYAIPHWHKRFINNMADYFSAVEEELQYNFKKNLLYPGREQYMALRLRTSAVFPLVDLLEIATDRILPDAVLNHPSIHRLIVLANRLMAWFNDCISSKREHGIESTNLVLIIQHETKCTLEEALVATIEQHDQDIEEFMHIRSSLPDFVDLQAAVETFIQGLEWMIAGHGQWYSYTRRYAETGQDRIAETELAK